MPSGATTATASNFIKRYYTPQVTINTISKVESRTLNLITHDTKGSGDDYNFLTIYGDNPSGSQDFTEAQTTGQRLGVEVVAGIELTKRSRRKAQARRSRSASS